MAVYAFGWGKFGQLGTGNFEDCLEPFILETLKGKRIISVSCGESHSIAVTQMGDCWIWGRGKEGQLGNGERNNSNFPQLIKALKHERIILADCGSHHCIALTDQGKVYIWGRLYKQGEDGAKQYFGFSSEQPLLKTKQMLDRSMQKYLSGSLKGEEADTTAFGSFLPYIQSVPKLIEEFKGIRVKHVAAGYSYTAVTTEDGRLFTWGFNEKGQLGHGSRYNQEFPKQVMILASERVVKVACGQQHSIILTEKGEVFSCGLGVFGQLGHGELTDELLPRRIQQLNHRIVQISCGTYYSALLSDTGKVFTFGHSEYGQHGGSQNNEDWDTGHSKEKLGFHSIPREVGGLEDKRIIDIACGYLHTIAVSDSNEIYSWGWGASGMLGHGNRRFHLIPKSITSLSGEPTASVSAGWKHSLVVKSGSQSTFCFDYKTILNNPKFSDIMFEVEKKTIYAHKCILVHRAPYFKSLFLLHERFIGNVPEKLKISGVKYPVFMAMLNYLYTDHLKVGPHLVLQLQTLAKFYRIPRLVSLCERASGESNISIPPSTVSQELVNAINDPSYSDMAFTFQDGTKVFGNKCILLARSPYFSRLFQSGFKERNQFEVPIDENISPSTFQAILEYIYGGQENIQPENAVDLLQASDRFMIDDLKLMVESFIEQSVDLENAAWLLEISDRFNSPKLRRVCMELICESSRETWDSIQKSSGFVDIAFSSPHLIREIDYRVSRRNFIQPGELLRMKQK